MDHTFEAARIHREELDREIETLRTERLIAAARPASDSPLRRMRIGAGRALIAAGTALVGGRGRPSASPGRAGI